MTLKCAALRALAATMGVTGKLETFKVRARASFPHPIISSQDSIKLSTSNPTQCMV